MENTYTYMGYKDTFMQQTSEKQQQLKHKFPCKMETPNKTPMQNQVNPGFWAKLECILLFASC